MAASHGLNKYTHIPLKATSKSQQERPAMPEEQSVHARDGVADPHGCGNPLRSGIADLSAAPDSQPPATSHQPPATRHFPAPPLRPQTTRPSHQSDITTPTRKACYARRAKRLAGDGVADPHGCGNPLRSGTAVLSAAPDSQPPAPSSQLPATSPKLPAPSPSHKKNGRPGFP
jgi:hypothetical protein